MSRKKLFKEDHQRLQAIVETIILLANECADRSAEYYRRHQIESHEQDLELSNLLRDAVTELKNLEERVGAGSAIDKVMSQRIAEEPGFFGMLFGFNGKKRRQIGGPAV